MSLAASEVESGLVPATKSVGRTHPEALTIPSSATGMKKGGLTRRLSCGEAKGGLESSFH